jgi:hypothetical protein
MPIRHATLNMEIPLITDKAIEQSMAFSDQVGLVANILHMSLWKSIKTARQRPEQTLAKGQGSTKTQPRRKAGTD